MKLLRLIKPFQCTAPPHRDCSYCNKQRHTTSLLVREPICAPPSAGADTIGVPLLILGACILKQLFAPS